MRWPAANAAVLDLCEPGSPDDSNEVQEPGDAIWTGDAEAVLIRARETVISGGENTPVETDVVIVRKPPGVLATAKSGDQGKGMTILVEDRRTGSPAQARFRLAKVEHRGIGEAESVRYELIDERVVS